MKKSTRTHQPATSNRRPATGNAQPATCNPQPATCNSDPATPISPYAISVLIGRTPRSVQAAIRRLRIVPIIRLSAGRAYYDPVIADAVKAELRKPNRVTES